MLKKMRASCTIRVFPSVQKRNRVFALLNVKEYGHAIDVSQGSRVRVRSCEIGTAVVACEYLQTAVLPKKERSPSN